MKIYAQIDGQRKLVEHTEIKKTTNFSGQIAGMAGTFMGAMCEIADDISYETGKMVWFKFNDTLIRIKNNSKKTSSL